MKTGRLLKFRRPRGEVQAYLYRDGGEFRASVFVLTAEARRQKEAAAVLSGGNERAVEDAVRAWVDRHFPR